MRCIIGEGEYIEMWYMVYIIYYVRSRAGTILRKYCACLTAKKRERAVATTGWLEGHGEPPGLNLASKTESVGVGAYKGNKFVVSLCLISTKLSVQSAPVSHKMERNEGCEGNKHGMYKDMHHGKGTRTYILLTFCGNRVSNKTQTHRIDDTYKAR